MANQILTIQMVTNEALDMFLNSNNFLKGIDKTYSPEFGRSGAKIGSVLNIRKSADYVTRHGPTAVPQNTIETSIPLTLLNQFGVDLAFSSVDMELSVDDFRERYLRRAMNNLAGDVAANIMSMVDGGTGQGGAQHLVHNVDANGNTVAPTIGTFFQAGAILTNNGYPEGSGDRLCILDPITQARTVSGMAGYFNPTSDISRQTKDGTMGRNILGVGEFMSDPTVIKHVTGSFTAGTVNGAGQTGTTVTVAGITGTLNQGDVITIAGVNAVNYTTKASTQTPRQFVVTQPVASGGTTIQVYPAITPYTVTGGIQSQTAYQTVDTSPANGAAIALVTKANEVYRKNILFAPKAFTMATADLPLPGGVQAAARATYGGISMRMVQYYTGNSDQFTTRLDILFGSALLRPEWVVAVADAV